MLLTLKSMFMKPNNRCLNYSKKNGIYSPGMRLEGLTHVVRQSFPSLRLSARKLVWGTGMLTEEVHMQQYQKLALAAVAAAAVISGCASRQPASTAVVVVPQTQAAPATQSTAATRGGTVVAVQNRDMGSSGSQGMSSSSSSSASSAPMIGQMVTVQFEDGKRELYHVTAGGQQFQVGDRVTVTAAEGTPLITRTGM